MIENNNLIVIDKASSLDVFTNKDCLQLTLHQIESQAKNIVFDVDTKKGRDAIKSLAYTVARTKTYLDDLGKDLVSQYKELPKKIDASRKYMRDSLDALRDDIRKPLDAWEEEQARLAAIEAEKQRQEQLMQEILACLDEAYFMNVEFDINQEKERLLAIEHAEKQKQAQLMHEEQIRQEAIAATEARLERDRIMAEEKHRQELKRQETELMLAAHQEQERLNNIERQKIRDEENIRREHERKLESERLRQEIEKQQYDHVKKVHDNLIAELTDIGWSYSHAEKLITLIREGSITGLSINY